MAINKELESNIVPTCGETTSLGLYPATRTQQPLGERPRQPLQCTLHSSQPITTLPKIGLRLQATLACSGTIRCAPKPGYLVSADQPGHRFAAWLGAGPFRTGERVYGCCGHHGGEFPTGKSLEQRARPKPGAQIRRPCVRGDLSESVTFLAMDHFRQQTNELLGDCMPERIMSRISRLECGRCH